MQIKQSYRKNSLAIAFRNVIHFRKSSLNKIRYVCARIFLIAMVKE